MSHNILNGLTSSMKLIREVITIDVELLENEDSLISQFTNDLEKNNKYDKVKIFNMKKWGSVYSLNFYIVKKSKRKCLKEERAIIKYLETNCQKMCMLMKSFCEMEV